MDKEENTKLSVEKRVVGMIIKDQNVETSYVIGKKQEDSPLLKPSWFVVEHGKVYFDEDKK